MLMRFSVRAAVKNVHVDKMCGFDTQLAMGGTPMAKLSCKGNPALVNQKKMPYHMANQNRI